jgi:selenocysteine lyase/cysteine desulfurase
VTDHPVDLPSSYLDEFAESPGYLDFARLGPPSRRVVDAMAAAASRVRAPGQGTLDLLLGETAAARGRAARLLATRVEQVTLVSSTSAGLFTVALGQPAGNVVVPARELPANRHPWVLAAAARGGEVRWLDTPDGRLTPDGVAALVDRDTTAVAVSLVDFRTGYLADLDGIRQVIGDRLLIVDAIQGFGVVDAPYQVADIVASGGQKWTRAGWGTGFLALSDRAAERLTPVFSGFSATDEDLPLDEVIAPSHGAAAFRISNPGPIAQARFATALEEISGVGVAQIAHCVRDKTERLLAIADEFGIPVSSPRNETERAGIVVLKPATDQLTVLTASLFNHGVSATTRQGTVRLSAHVTTNEETFDMLRASFTSYAAAVNI